MKRSRWLVGLAAAALTLAACQQAPAGPAGSPAAGGGIVGGLTSRDKIRIEVVTTARRPTRSGRS
ncbi:MAG TPA: hypothetical protein VNJ28_00400 [Candidatus Limnocylindrales bacterium]|nr:hypothetical protein [Candidatus Limnocylindrales bacterium]